ncbi:MAG: fibrobacter succinogenes major paralogous domain-containing protein [Fibrobacter sp.]|nr:fibrobacter succinogenes major paralogous domain-containing protein [Fibrobacter sp.]
MIVTLILFLTALLFVGCSSSDDVAGGTSIDKGIVALEQWKVEGVSQKGPFITGSTVNVLELGGNTLLQTGKIFKSSIKSDKGDFTVSGTALVSQYALLEVNGYYRNEVSGKKSSSPLTLNAIVDLSNREKANVNLLTHLEYERVLHLVSNGKSVLESKAQAEREILETMGMSESEDAFEDLDIFKSGDENAKLLAISILLQGDEDVAEFTERIAKFAIKFAQEGSWNDSLTRATIADWACEREQRNMYGIIRQNILKWGITDSLPDFEKYANQFWADNYGLGKCSDANKGDTAQNTNSLSARHGELFVCNNAKWVSVDKKGSNYMGIFGTMTDERDGQTYKTVEIGEQVWMAENLNYNYHTEITQSLCYQNNEENCAKYGRLYTFAAAVDSAGLFGEGGLGCGNTRSACSNLKESSRGVCPEGWHLPSKKEWEQLFSAVGGEVLAITALRTADGIGTDDYGFNIIKSGAYFDGFNDLEGNHCDAYFWTSTNYDEDINVAYGEGLSYVIFELFDEENSLSAPWFQNSDNYKEAMSVRCVMD